MPSAVVVALTLSTAVAVAAPGGAPPSGGGQGEPGNPQGRATFEISGSVEGLVPTVTRVLPLKIENPERQAISVVALEVDVSDASVTCTADELELVLPELPITVPGRSEIVVDVTARLVDGVDDACQGAVWPLSWTGIGERA